MSNLSTGVPGIEFIKNNWAALQGLPHPNETWRVRDYPEMFERVSISAISELDLVSIVDRHANDTRSWQTHPRAYEAIQTMAENYSGPTMPGCEHPFHVVNTGESYKCKFCDGEYSRPEMDAARGEA